MRALLRSLWAALCEVFRDPVEESFTLRRQELRVNKLFREALEARQGGDERRFQELYLDWREARDKWERMAQAYERRFLS